MEIKNRWTAYVIWADATKADLYEADLYGAYLREADLRGADLREADLRGADLYEADLRGASLRGANLREADLRGANLRGADLYGADLRGVKITVETTLNWSAHNLIAEILLQAAGRSVPYRMLAGLIAISVDWCWDQFRTLKVHGRSWAIETLKPYSKDGDFEKRLKG